MGGGRQHAGSCKSVAGFGAGLLATGEAGPARFLLNAMFHPCTNSKAAMQAALLLKAGGGIAASRVVDQGCSTVCRNSMPFSLSSMRLSMRVNSRV